MLLSLNPPWRRVRRAGAEGEILLRADSGFWNAKLFAWLHGEGIAYSIGVKLQKHVREAIEAIDESVWVTLNDYPDTGQAQIAETTLGTERLIVRRVRTRPADPHRPPVDPAPAQALALAGHLRRGSREDQSDSRARLSAAPARQGRPTPLPARVGAPARPRSPQAAPRGDDPAPFERRRRRREPPAAVRR